MDFWCPFGLPLAPLGALLASFLVRIRALFGRRVPERPQGWFFELLFIVLGALFDAFGNYL